MDARHVITNRLMEKLNVEPKSMQVCFLVIKVTDNLYKKTGMKDFKVGATQLTAVHTCTWLRAE